MDARKLAEKANEFHRALHSSETDEIAIIALVTMNTKRELQSIKAFYYSIYKKFLEDDLRKQTRGSFLNTVLALLFPISETEAVCLKKAIQGFESNVTVIIQLLCSKDSYEIQSLRSSYIKLYGETPEKDIQEKEGGSLGRVFRSLLQLLRSRSSAVDKDLARREANELYEAGKGRVVVEEMEFVRIMCTRSFFQLKATFEEYYSLFKVEIETTIKNIIKGPLKLALLTIAKCAINKPKYFAEEINSCLKRLMTKDDYLLRLIVSRHELDLSEIKIIYEDIYGKQLSDNIRAHVTGNFAKLLITLIDKN